MRHGYAFAFTTSLVPAQMFHEASTGFRVAGDGSLVEPNARPPTLEPIVLAGGIAR